MRALIVDRYKMNRELLSAYLVQSISDIVIVGVSAVSGGISLFKEEVFDIIFIDWQSTSTRGLDDIIAMRAKCDQTPIILIDDGTRSIDFIKAYRSGVDGIVPKALPAHFLLLAIQIVRAGEKYIPSAFLAEIEKYEPRRAVDVKENKEYLPELTRRERDVLALLFAGQSNAQIAHSLSIAGNTVRLYVSAILRKLQAQNRLQAVRIAAERGFQG